MPIVDVERIDEDATLAEVIDAFAKLQKAFDYLMQGGLDSKNAREFGGWLVGLTELQSRDKKVGMSTEETGADDIRFWSGDVKTGSPNFKVTQAGILTAVQAAFLSALSYPRVTLNESADSLLKASLDANHYIYISPDYVGGTPGLVWEDISNCSMQMFLLPDGSGDFMINTSAGKINIKSSIDDIVLQCGTGKKITVNSWNELYNVFNGQSMQTALNAKANSFSGVSGTVYVSATSGGPATTPITFSNGIRTS